MEPEGSFPSLQVPATCPHPEPHRSCPCPHIPLLESILILSSRLRLDLLSSIFSNADNHLNYINKFSSSWEITIDCENHNFAHNTLCGRCNFLVSWQTVRFITTGLYKILKWVLRALYCNRGKSDFVWNYNIQSGSYIGRRRCLPYAVLGKVEISVCGSLFECTANGEDKF
jgi:hypothetical protein